MDTEFLTKLESQYGELASRITQLEPLDDQPAKFAALDQELVKQLAQVRQHYSVCKQIEELQIEGEELDKSINSILIKLDDCRKQLEKLPPASISEEASRKVDSQTLLDYATRITRFTRKMPGTVDPSVLPWPTEDWLRRGMLATLTIQDEQKQVSGEPATHLEPHMDPHMDPHTEPHTEPQTGPEAAPPTQTGPPASSSKPARKPKKISLDFDSDSD